MSVQVELTTMQGIFTLLLKTKNNRTFGVEHFEYPHALDTKSKFILKRSLKRVQNFKF